MLELAPKPFARDGGPVRDVAATENFIARQSAYIAQTSLFGYLKERMGTRYSEIFQNKEFSGAIKKASAHIFLSCAADLSIYVTARLWRAAPNLGDPSDFACHVYDTAVREGVGHLDVEIDADAAVNAFAARLSQTDWGVVGDGENAFTQSPPDLLRNAPVLDDLKELDSEIVTNSMRFRWQTARRRWKDRADPDAIAADWAVR
ncbi:MAG: esterase [Pseudomonadota bacterium]